MSDEINQLETFSTGNQHLLSNQSQVNNYFLFCLFINKHVVFVFVSQRMHHKIWLYVLMVHGKIMVLGGNQQQLYIMLHFMYQPDLCK